MQKHKSSRSGKSSNKFETASLNKKSLNSNKNILSFFFFIKKIIYIDIDDSWKVIGNLKSGMRDLEKKLNKYSENIKLLSSISNSSFNSTSNSFNLHNDSKNKMFTSTSFNSALKPGIIKKSASKYIVSEKPIYENSYLSSTIQACDPSLDFFNTSSNDHQNYSCYDFDQPFEYPADIKCLNDFSTDLNVSYLNFKSNSQKDFVKPPRTTRVNVQVPSGNFFLILLLNISLLKIIIC